MKASSSLRWARRRSGLTQAQLAARAGVPQSTVGRIESGATIPRVDTLDTLLRACGHRLNADRDWSGGVDLSLIDMMLSMNTSERAAYGQASSENLAKALNVSAKGH